MGTQTRAGGRDVYWEVRVQVRIIVPSDIHTPELGS